MNDCFGEMRDQEMATQKWENEGGRIAAEVKRSSFEARLKGPSDHARPYRMSQTAFGISKIDSNSPVRLPNTTRYLRHPNQSISAAFLPNWSNKGRQTT